MLAVSQKSPYCDNFAMTCIHTTIIGCNAANDTASLVASLAASLAEKEKCTLKQKEATKRAYIFVEILVDLLDVVSGHPRSLIVPRISGI